MQEGYFVAVRIHSLIHPFIYSLFQCLLGTGYGPGSVIGPGDIAVKKINLEPVLKCVSCCSKFIY